MAKRYNGKAFETFKVGQTITEKPVNLPIEEKHIMDFIEQIQIDFTYDEIFQIFAITEYLYIHEKRKFSKQANFAELFLKISTEINLLLRNKDKLSDVMNNANIKNSLEILKLGKKLVRLEFKQN